LIVAGLLGPRVAQAVPSGSPVLLTDVRVETREEAVAVHLQTTGPAEYRAFFLQAPARVVVDLEGTTARWGGRLLASEAGPIREIRGSQWTRWISRVVVELTRPVEYRVEPRHDGLVVLLEPGAGSGGQAPVAQAPREGESAPASEAPAAPAGGAWRDWTIKGRVEVGSRHYLNDRGQGLEDDNILLEGELDVTYDLNDFTRFRLRPRLSIDPLETERNRYEPLDAYVEYTTSRWALLAGQLLESWAIVDTFNPADVLNRRDFERDFYDPDKLGELMLRFRYFFPEAGPVRQPTLSLYLLPLHREAPLPGNRNRFRLDATGDNRGDLSPRASVPSFDLAYAARLSATIGSADVFLFYFGGPGRIPGFDVSPLGVVTPVYYRVDMIGGGFQWAMGQWLFKLETAYTSTRDPHVRSGFAHAVPDSYFQYVIGVDRTFTDVLGKTELTVTLEYAGEDDTSMTDLSGLRPYKSDVFLGIRWQLNDPRRTEIMASVVADVLVDEQLYLLDFQTTLYRDLKLVVGGQFVNRASNRRPDRFSTFNLFPNNSNVRVSLRYEF
jgi:hypothetical protein